MADLLGILMRPRSTIREMAEKDSSLREPPLLLLVIGVFTSISGYLRAKLLFSSGMEGLVHAPSVEAVGTIAGVFAFLFGLLFIYLGWILESIAVHGFAKLLGGSGGLRKFSELTGWCQTPRFFSAVVLLIVWATQGITTAILETPRVTFSRVFSRLMLFWSLVLVGISVAHEHKLSRTRSAIAVAVPALIYFILIYGILPGTIPIRGV